MSFPLRLLIVDDDDAFRLALKTALADIGYVVEACDCGETAIDLLRTSVFNVILLDYRMPGLSGLNVLQWMHEQKMETPVIMLTAVGSENIAVEAMKLGAYDYFAKDTIDIIHLPIAINSAYERFLFKKEKVLRESNEQVHVKNLKAAEVFRATLSSLSNIVNNSISVLLLSIQDDMQSLLPSVKEEMRMQFVQAFDEIAQNLNVISFSIRAMLNLTEAMCKQIETSEGARNMESLLREEMKTLELTHKNVVG